jgi:hypothetical protein
MRTPSTRVRRTIMLSTTPVAVLLAGLMVWQGTNAAFSADTRNLGNSWETGSVTITDDDNGSAMFNVQNLVPGQTGSRCIVVTASPTVASTVKTYTHSLQQDGLEDNVLVSMEEGTGGSFADCTGFAAVGDPTGFMTLTEAALINDYAIGVLPWTVAAGTSSKTYRISWEFDTSGLTQAQVDALQGKSASFNIEWEMQNN